jgi:hypothetical protein
VVVVVVIVVVLVLELLTGVMLEVVHVAEGDVVEDVQVVLEEKVEIAPHMLVPEDFEVRQCAAVPFVLDAEDLDVFVNAFGDVDDFAHDNVATVDLCDVHVGNVGCLLELLELATLTQAWKWVFVPTEEESELSRQGQIWCCWWSGVWT